MSIPKRWHDYFEETVVGTHEGGYVNTQYGGTLFGMMANYFSALRKDIPKEELEALPAWIKQDLNNPRALFQKVGRMLQPIGGGDQPATGIPRQSFARADKPGQHEGEIRAAKDLIYGMLYREYVAKPGYDKLDDLSVVSGYGDAVPVDGNRRAHVIQKIQEQLVDIDIHGGSARALAILVKGGAESNILPGEKFHQYPYLTSSDLQTNNSFAMAKNGGAYGTDAMKRRVFADMQGARMEDLEQLHEWLKPWRKLSKDCAVGDEHRRCIGENIRADSYELGYKVDRTSAPLNIARVQVASPWVGQHEIAVETDKGLVRYTVDDQFQVASILELPKDTQAIGQQGALPYRTPHTRAPALLQNPYRDGTVLIASADAQYYGTRSLPQVFYASPEFNKAAIDQHNRNAVLGIGSTAFAQDAEGKLLPEKSFYVVYAGPTDAMYVTDRITPEFLQQCRENNRALAIGKPPASEAAIALPSTTPVKGESQSVLADLLGALMPSSQAATGAALTVPIPPAAKGPTR